LNPKDTFIHPLFLNFISSASNKKENKEFSTCAAERVFAEQTDPFFSFYLFCAGALCITMTAIKLIIPQMAVLYELKCGFVITLFIILVSLFYTFYKAHQVFVNFIYYFLFYLLINFVIPTKIVSHNNYRLNTNYSLFFFLLRITVQNRLVNLFFFGNTVVLIEMR
jgi:hypothetical protein